jgi:hypothetical protein
MPHGLLTAGVRSVGMGRLIRAFTGSVKLAAAFALH